MKNILLSVFYLLSFSLYAQKPAESIQGNWFNADGSNTWAIGLHEKYAVYDAQFWDYGAISHSEGLHTIELKQPDARKIIRINEVAGGLFIRDGKTSMRVEIKRKADDRLRLPNKRTFTTDFIGQGQVELMGVLKAKGDMPLTAAVINNEPFNVDQSKYTVNVDEYGRFKLNFPLQSPQTIMLLVGDAFTSFMAEPDSKMAVYIDEASFSDGIESWYEVKGMLFMGDMAQENEEYRLYSPEYMKVRNYFENDSMQRTLEPMDYLSYRTGLLEVHEGFNKEYFGNQILSAKLQELAERQVRLYAANDLMRYSWLHNMRTTRKRVDLPQEYVDQVKTMILNDPRELLSTEYGYVMGEMMRLATPAESNKAHDLRLEKIYSLLISKAETRSEKQLVEKWRTEEAKRENHLGYAKLTKELKVFSDQYSPLIYDINMQITWDVMLERVKGYDKVAKSSMISRYLQSAYFKQGNDVSDKIWKDVNDLDLVPYVMSYLEKERTDLAILKKERFVEGIDISDSEEDILGQLKKKYAGKVVYIDVWAVWCGPCISEFSYLPEIKANLKEDEDVVFVYLCAQSPKKGWETMIKKHNLKGDNLFLDDRQYGIFDKVTNVTGFPTYMLITKEGKLVREGIKRPSAGDKLVDQLKEFADRK